MSSTTLPSPSATAPRRSMASTEWGGLNQDAEKGHQLCSQSPVSLRRTQKRTSQSPRSLRPRWLAFLSILGDHYSVCHPYPAERSRLRNLTAPSSPSRWNGFSIPTTCHSSSRKDRGSSETKDWTSQLSSPW